MVNFLLIGILSYEVYNLKKIVDKQTTIVGNLKLNDLDDDFWRD